MAWIRLLRNRFHLRCAHWMCQFGQFFNVTVFLVGDDYNYERARLNTRHLGSRITGESRAGHNCAHWKQWKPQILEWKIFALSMGYPSTFLHTQQDLDWKWAYYAPVPLCMLVLTGRMSQVSGRSWAIICHDNPTMNKNWALSYNRLQLRGDLFFGDIS